MIIFLYFHQIIKSYYIWVKCVTANYYVKHNNTLFKIEKDIIANIFWFRKFNASYKKYISHLFYLNHFRVYFVIKSLHKINYQQWILIITHNIICKLKHKKRKKHLIIVRKPRVILFNSKYKSLSYFLLK